MSPVSSMTVEEAIFALLLGTVGIFAMVVPFMGVIAAAKKKQEAEQGADVNSGFAHFVLMFFFVQLLAGSAVIFVNSILSIVIKNTSIQKIYSVFWNARNSQASDGAIDSILSLIFIINRFFYTFNAIIPFLLLGLVAVISKSSAQSFERGQEASDIFRHYIMVFIYAVIVGVLYIAWSNFGGVVLMVPDNENFYKLMQDFWAEAIGADTSGVTQRIVTPDGMSDAEALRKGLYVPKPYQDPDKLF